ncbi:MAG: sodium:calcium antiporter [Halobacteriales archaeon]
MIELAVIAVVGTALVYVGGTRFEAAADSLASHYGLPAAVQGAVVVAVGSSAPELATALIAPLRHGEFELGVAVIIGSAVFNILVIPALAALSTDGWIDSTPKLVYKEAQFYMLAVSVFVLTLCFSVIYFPLGGGEGLLTRELALLPLATYLLYVFIQYEETVDGDLEVGVADIDLGRSWLYFFGGIAVIGLGVEGLVVTAIELGDITGTNSYLWGLTAVAAATSLPDAVVSVTASRRERDVTSVANVFGSNVFDLLVVVPLAVLLSGSTAVDFTLAVPLLGYLVFSTVALFAFMRTGYVLGRLESYGLLVIYAGFLGWLSLETLGAVDLLTI